jgi:hypothetical protein
MLTWRAWQLPAGIAATIAAMSASCGARGAAVLVGGWLTVPVVGDDDVLVVEKPHPASVTPTRAMMVDTAARRMMFTVPGLGSVAVRSACNLTAADVCPGCPT